MRGCFESALRERMDNGKESVLNDPVMKCTEIRFATGGNRAHIPVAGSPDCHHPQSVTSDVPLMLLHLMHFRHHLTIHHHGAAEKPYTGEGAGAGGSVGGQGNTAVSKAVEACQGVYDDPAINVF